MKTIENSAEYKQAKSSAIDEYAKIRNGALAQYDLAIAEKRAELDRERIESATRYKRGELEAWGRYIQHGGPESLSTYRKELNRLLDVRTQENIEIDARLERAKEEEWAKFEKIRNEASRQCRQVLADIVARRTSA